MWIVKIALQRPYTFIVLAILILLLGVFAILRTATDIFPSINIPVIAAIWNYTGLQPEEMATRIILFSERTAQTTVNDVQHTESQSLNGIAVVKYFFQPGANEELSFAQITGVSQTQLRSSPPGTTPPFILAYNASTVPIIQLALSSDSLSEAQIFDLGNNIVRTGLSTIPGAAMPYPYGGKQRQVQVDLDPSALRARGLSGADVTNAIAAQNLILPAGTQKVGDLEYFVGINASPNTVAEMNDLPISAHNGSVVYVRDVAHVRDGYPPQTNIARLEGRRAVLMSVLKSGTSSTLDVINAIKAKLPQIRATLPESLKIEAIGDQSLFVRSAISGVVREAVIAAALTGLMILLFLGSWRSTLIISLSIPLSILASIACLAALGQTINIMTLGGLALAVGILVDDATVTIENINWHLENGEEVEPAILAGAQQIALPALVSTLAICIVFVPMFLLAGIAKFLFVPLAEAVVFAMLASYLLSRTLVPTLSKYWLQKHAEHAAESSPGILKRFQLRFEKGFERVRDRYHALLETALANGPRFATIFLAAMAASAILAFPFGRYLPGLGQDFFPTVDSGQIKLHLRARTGLRIEETAALCDAVEALLRENIPATELSSIVDNIGLPYSGINLTYSTSAPVGPSDADIFIALKEKHHASADYQRRLRPLLARDFPSVTFAFLPADIVSQTLNFGLPSPVDVQIVGPNFTANRAYAANLLLRLRDIPGAVDLRIQQPADYPQLKVEVDRTKAELVGLTQHDVASNMLVSLSGSFQTSPSFWIDPANGTQYQVVAQTPQYQLESPNALAMTPLTNGTGGAAQVLANVASFHRSFGQAVVSHYDSMPVIDIFGSAQDADLGFISAQVNKIVADTKKDLPKGSHVVVRGQVQTMNASFFGLLVGLLGAVVLVYLLIVVNFQSWLDPFIIITALPAALAGIVWMLFLTHTTVSVPALTGAIMCMGVATANSVLMVSFARERMNAGDDPAHAASQAGFQRFRPVLMTALAMIIGMVPMALGLGDGGEQNAPLGRAVIGGLVFATIATLFFVPAVFSIIHGAQVRRAPRHLPEPLMTEASPPNANDKASHVVRYAWIALVVALVLAAWGVISRVHARSNLAKETTAAAVPQVTTLKPSHSPGSEDLVLPGSVQALIEAPIYARTSGYLKFWYTDIGSQVKKGQLLAEIDAPEVDQQYSQAQADLGTAHANSELAVSTNERWKGLLATHSVSQQDADAKAGDAAAKHAAEESAGANLRRLRDLESFKRVLAPFDGVVTQRNTDIGALITAGQSAGSPLFRVADTTKLRIYVLVPEPYAATTVPGMDAALRFTEHPGKDYPAAVVRTANALDPALRTLQVELQVDNPRGELFPGAYAEVHFKVPGSSASLSVPANALLFRAAGLQVATVDSGDHVRLKSIVPGRDFGKSIEVLSGISASDNIVVNPPDSLTDGAAVRIAPPPKPAAAQGEKKSS